MNASNKKTIRVYIVVICFLLLASCNRQESPNKITPSLTPHPTINPSPVIDPTHTLTPTLPAITPTPGIYFQLTYVTACQGADMDCIYAVNVGCLETDRPCIGEPQLLFQLLKQPNNPRPPIANTSWSPDGQKIVFDATGFGGYGDIYIGDWNGSAWQNLTESINFDGYPAWSPDGSVIVYSSNIDGKIQVFSVRPNGDDVSQLFGDLVDFSGIFQLAWSPDAEQLAFVDSDMNGNYQIFVANPDGSNLRQLTTRPVDHFQPDFSPDGRLIVAIRESDRHLPVDEMILIGVDGDDEAQVILNANYHLYSPKWSPNGGWIAFISDFEGDKNIYLIRSDGTGLMNVTQSPNTEYDPAWRVVGTP